MSDREPKSLRHDLSRDGFDFILSKEGDGPKLYFPGGDSGVTIGHGYDLKKRTRSEVESDLRQAGVGSADAATIAQGVGLKGSRADEFARNHKSIHTRYRSPLAKSSQVIIGLSRS